MSSSASLRGVVPQAPLQAVLALPFHQSGLKVPFMNEMKGGVTVLQSCRTGSRAGITSGRGIILVQTHAGETM